MKWHRRADGSYVSDRGYVILHEGPNWVSNRSDTEPIPGWNSNSSLALAKMNCELDLAKRSDPLTYVHGDALREDWARSTVAAAGKDWATHMAKFDGTVVER